MGKEVLGWNFDPVKRKFVSKAEALALGLRPPSPGTSSPPPPPPAAPAVSNVLPFGKTVTFGDALEAIDLKKAGPDPELEADDDDDELEAAPPAAAAPPESPGGPVAAPNLEDEDPDSFAQLAGKVATTVGISVLEGLHRRRGVEPNELDPDDVEQLERETTKAVRRGLGDRPIPWWAPVVSAWGMAYFSMSNGAKRIGAPPDQLVVPPPEVPPAASSPAPSSPVPPRPPSTRPPPAKPAPIQFSPTRAA